MGRTMMAVPVRLAGLVVVGLLAFVVGATAGTASAQSVEFLQVAPSGSDPTCVSPCASIQQAVNLGSQDLQSGAAIAVLIEVAPGFYSGNVTIPAFSGTGPLTIQGAGSSTELGGTGDGPAVTVSAGGRVTILDLSIVGGRAINGGGVYDAGTATLQRVTVAFNTATNVPPDKLGTGRGGGIYNKGSLTLLDSTVTHNQASVGGGGLQVVSSGTLTAARDAFINNSVGPVDGVGGGISIFAQTSGCCSVVDSTIASNSVVGAAGIAGVVVQDAIGVQLQGDTIADNVGSVGIGGVDTEVTLVDLAGTVLAHNPPYECSGVIPHGGNVADDSSCGPGVSVGDPQLQPLASNGGPTETMAIPASSPAYDINTFCAGTDQRGVSRLQLGASRCDAGAYQLEAPSTYVANPASASVTAYASRATGDAAPTLTLAGSSTRLSQPTGVLVDMTGRVLVANKGNNSVTEYAPEANGNVAPVVRIAGSLTRLAGPQDLALDPSGDLFVTNGSGSVTEYAPGASGNVAPTARIAGSNTKLSSPRGIVLDASGALWVSNGNGTVTAYPAGANGNVAPLGRLYLSAGTGRPYGLNFNPTGNLVVADRAGSDVFTFAPSFTGPAGPLSVLYGASPALGGPLGLDLDVYGDIFVADNTANSVNEYPPGSIGRASPLAVIAGPDTGLLGPAYLSELPPPPAPRVRATTAQRQSRQRIARGGIEIHVSASGKLAFRSRPVTITASVRVRGRTVAAARPLPLRPGRRTILLIPTRRAAALLRAHGLRTITVVIKIRDGAGTQTRKLMIRLTR